jgi:signal transduction protein with GAF and PtsI domain
MARQGSIFKHSPVERNPVGLWRAGCDLARGVRSKYRELRDKPCVTKDGQAINLSESTPAL